MLSTTIFLGPVDHPTEAVEIRRYCGPLETQGTAGRGRRAREGVLVLAF
jgi:hypothetical protein